jgi:tetratricopeptide (TPR) repeat protein
MADAAVREHPRSPKLWVIRGNLLELARLETGYTLNESAFCYRQAIRVDPFFIEAYEDLAFFLDAVMGNRRKAKRFFEKARLLKRAARAGIDETPTPNLR